MWTQLTCGLLIFGTCLLVCEKVYSQPVSFRHYSTDEGFTGAAFKKIAQDSLGFLWISTGSGIYKFDGYNFINYKSIEGDSLSLPQGNQGRTIRVAPSGVLWIGIPDKLAYFSRELDGFKTFPVSTGGIKPNTIWFENDHVIWLGTVGTGLVRFDIEKQEQSYYLNKAGKANNHFSRNTIYEIIGGDKFLLLGTAHGIWKFDLADKEFHQPKSNNADSVILFNGNIKRIFRNDDFYWLWADDQLLKTNSELLVLQRENINSLLLQFDYNKKFVNADIQEIDRGKDGTFWIASQGLGLFSYNANTNQLINFRNNSNDPNSLPSDVLTSVLVDRDNNIWMGTLNKGIAKLKKQSILFYNYLNGKSSTGIELLPGKDSHRIIVGTNGHGAWSGIVKPNQLSNLTLERLKMESSLRGFESIVEVAIGKENIWLGSIQNGILGLPIDKQSGIINEKAGSVFRYQEENQSNTLSNNFVTSLFEEANGTLWVGTYSAGLNRIDPINFGKPGSVIHYKHISKDTASLIHNGVFDLIPLRDGSIVVGTNGGVERITKSAEGKLNLEHIIKNISCMKLFEASDGVLMVSSKTGLYEGTKNNAGYHFTKAPLPGSPFMTAVEEDKLGRLWCMSYEGLFFYDRKNKIVLTFKKEDGLPSSRSVSAGGSAQTPEGMMIFSNAEGITLFDPLSLQINGIKPQPVLTQLRINNKVVSNTNKGSKAFTISESINTLKELVLNHTQNILVLEFSAMDFTAPEKNLYQYRLEGFDNDWMHTDWKNRTATYTNLNPGNYTFKVRASNSDGIWNDNETALSIHVLPPPWKTWWAYTLYSILFTGALFVARRNIIQRERLSAKLKLEHLELQKIQEIDKVKTNFFTNISHEFRTPLTLIQGPVQNLITKLKNDKESETDLLLIQKNAERLLRLVNQLLELARLESGNLKVENSEGDLISFINTTIDSFSSMAIQRKISLVKQLPEKIINARFDKDKLEKIISNLIVNALKFTPENGAIIINASIIRTGNGGSQSLSIWVLDTGKGISHEQTNKIFERFYQVNEDGKQNVGTGIGLALCKELAEFLGGKLYVESKLGQGSKFTLELPIDIVSIVESTSIDDTITHIPIAQDQSTNGSGLHEHSEKPLLLIVEDHEDLRKFIITCLGQHYEYLEASNGIEGLQKTIEQIPTLVLSDVMMPGMDGIEMCHKIKDDHRTCHIPVILITAKASDQSKLAGLEMGADDYLIKPFNKDELMLKVRNQILTRTRIQDKIRLDLLSVGTTIRAESADERFLEQVKKIIEARMSDEQLSVESLASEVGVSRIQLYRKITALTGISGNEFIRQLRLQKAAQLIRQHWGPVSQVAYEVGFSNPSYFSKCFKDQYGVLPSEYAALP